MTVSPTPSSPAATAVMRGNRSRDTKPEVELRRILHRRGHRFRTDFPVAVEGRPIRSDIAFTRRRLAVFLDGCFWHGCPAHGSRPTHNGDYWAAKFERNRARDVRDTERLRAAGWAVVRVWEHEPPEQAARYVEQVLAEV